MPTPNPTTRREYKGAAAATTLVTGIAAGDLSLTLTAANNWPTGAVGKFIITIDRGQSNEERLLCVTQASRVVTVDGAGRGFDGTTAASHSAGATVECTLSAFDADEWNQHTAASTGVHGVATVAGLTETQTFLNKTLTDPTITFSGQNLTAAWTSYTPVWSAITTPPTLGNGTLTGSYLKVGKTVFFDIRLTIGSTTTLGSGAYKFGLPVAPASIAIHATATLSNPGGEGFVGQTDTSTSGGQTIFFLYDGTAALSNTNAKLTTGAVLAIAGMFQAA